MRISNNLRLLLRLIFFPAILLLITVLVLKTAAWFQEYLKQQNTPPPPVASYGIIMPVGYSVHGIDVSKHQGNIDWKRVSQMKRNGIQISFTFIKATEGITRQDNMFDSNWREASSNSLLRGAYHFYYPYYNIKEVLLKQLGESSQTL